MPNKPHASRLAIVCVAALLLAAVACGGEREPREAGPSRNQGEPRPFLMGVSSVPQRPSDASYRQAFEFAASAGEVILVQRVPPWEEFIPGGTISDRTERLTRLERELARANRLQLFLAIDPTDPADRGRLAALPDDLRGRDFTDGRVRSAFVSYAKYLALNYRPAYMALGVEVDMFFNRRGDAAFRSFQSLYFEAYDAVKDVSPDTLVFPTFQYENLQALLQFGQASQPAWALVPRFEPKIDAVAVSSFPGFAFGRINALPEGYYAQLKTRFQKPLILASIGWTSGPSPEGGNLEGDQAAFLRRALAEAEALGSTLVVWYLGRDVQDDPLPAFAPLATSGLYTADNRAKPAWLIWRTYRDRPPP
ncbi:MAG TPA: hypothetical protein VNN10_00955 [Dehalococcoidia bacterium]|nr:hypothetical protein [Dehalococcoidia bacterium]